ncbi:DNA methylase [Gordonia phage Getalong]|uniref:DNA methylase n=1 Tax=Gordonia phage Getalong TaxID=2315531 RepID=A0A386KEF5_9CAUD|nr:DNA methyltransferase [Gordonia phage Getalong]AYD83945.1 DNA methylase [Gordonia phage Getalong]UAW08327.1 DNA methylase [Gordonia phage Whitney]
MKTGSLFSGYGGLDMAVNAYFGSDTAWFVEYDTAPSKILAHHWPEVPNHGDVTTIDWTQVESVDILTGGFPCQPFSAAGRRAGEGDERHLWPYVLEAIRCLRPKYVVLENVAGLRSIGGYFDEPTLQCVCGWTGRRGGVHYREVDEVQHRDGHQGSDRHGNQGQRGAGADAERVRGDADHADPNKREALPDHHVDSERGGRGGVPEGGGTPSDPEVRTGCGRIEDRGDQDLARAHRDSGSLPSPKASDATGGGQHPDKRKGHTQQLVDAVLGLTGAPTLPLFDVGNE